VDFLQAFMSSNQQCQSTEQYMFKIQNTARVVNLAVNINQATAKTTLELSRAAYMLRTFRE